MVTDSGFAAFVDPNSNFGAAIGIGAGSLSTSLLASFPTTAIFSEEVDPGVYWILVIQDGNVLTQLPAGPLSLVLDGGSPQAEQGRAYEAGSDSTSIYFGSSASPYFSGASTYSIQILGA